MLYMINPVSAAELSRQSGSGTSWIIGGSSFENLCRDDHQHLPLDQAPAGTALEISQQLHTTLDGAILPGSESDSMGRVVLIASESSGDGLPERQALLDALGMKETVDGVNLGGEATLRRKEDLEEIWLGWEHDEDEYIQEELENNNSDVAKARRTTMLMARELKHHFEFNFSEEIVCAPVLYGGRASDGNLVCILSMRVWT